MTTDESQAPASTAWTENCPICNGSGEDDEGDACPNCNGSGQVEAYDND